MKKPAGVYFHLIVRYPAMPTFARPALAVLLAALLLFSPASFAFTSPLSAEAIREAYFLGQRHEGSFAHLLDKYSKRLPPPKTGPHISAITFLTPFAQLVRFSESYVGNYSAQQAELDHNAQEEVVEISVEILFTPSYGAVLFVPTGSRSGSPQSYRLRSTDFWKDVQARVFEGDQELVPERHTGEPNFFCGEGGCSLIGATLHLEFPASAFTADTVTVQVSPREGPEVSVDFDPTTLR
jgi:hypothetical protein